MLFPDRPREPLSCAQRGALDQRIGSTQPVAAGPGKKAAESRDTPAEGARGSWDAGEPRLQIVCLDLVERSREARVSGGSREFVA